MLSLITPVTCVGSGTYQLNVMHSLKAAFLISIAIATVVQAAQTCDCPDLDGVPGVYGGTAGGPAIQCAYPDGACTWDDVRFDAIAEGFATSRCLQLMIRQSGTLLNTAQPNCQRYITPYSGCPKDKTNASGALINTLVPYGCEYSEPDGSSIYCTWNAVRRSVANCIDLDTDSAFADRHLTV